MPHTSRQALSPSELVFQEHLIQERYMEIRGVELSVHEIDKIFRDLATIVVE